MKGLVNALLFIVISAAILLLGYAAYNFVIYVYSLYQTIDAHEQILTLISIVAVFVFVLMVRSGFAGRSAQKYDSVMIDAKIQVYLKLLDSLIPDDQVAFATTINKLRNDLIILADEPVLDCINRLSLLDNWQNDSELVQSKLRLIKAIRSDLGQQAGARVQAIEKLYFSRAMGVDASYTSA